MSKTPRVPRIRLGGLKNSSHTAAKKLGEGW